MPARYARRGARGVQRCCAEAERRLPRIGKWHVNSGVARTRDAHMQQR